MSNETQLRVIEAEPDDAGAGKARVSELVLNALSLKEGEIIEIKGKRHTAATVWRSLPEDHDDAAIRMDGLIRKNADVPLNDSVTIRRADVKDARRIYLASDIASPRPDRGFEQFVKYRFLRTPFVRGDTILLDVLGTPTPFKVFLTEPSGIVVVCESTPAASDSSMVLGCEGHPVRGARLMRFRHLKDVERKLGADYTRFRVQDLMEHEREDDVLTEAKKRANKTHEAVTVFVDIWEKRGKIITLEWATVKPDSTVEYIYDARKFRSMSTEERDARRDIELLLNSFQDHENRLQVLVRKLKRQIDAFDETLK